MTVETKPAIMWAVKAPVNGYFLWFGYTHGMATNECVKDHLDLTWKQLYRLGHRCIKVRVEEIQND